MPEGVSYWERGSSIALLAYLAEIEDTKISRFSFALSLLFGRLVSALFSKVSIIIRHVSFVNHQSSAIITIIITKTIITIIIIINK